MALALHGNAWLSDPSGPAPSLLPSNSTFRFVHDLGIDDVAGRWRPRELTFTDTADWFEHLRRGRLRRLALADASATGPLPAPVAAGFANAVPWSLVGASRRRRTAWSGHWEVTRRDDPDERIWSVRLGRLPAAPDSTVAAPGVAVAADDLDRALGAVMAFASSHGLGNWLGRFTVARGQLSTEAPLLPYHPDIAPPGSLSPQQHRLLAAAMHAWVFGGMGSWNDLGFDDEQERGELARSTRMLYDAIMAAFLAVTNVRPT